MKVISLVIVLALGGCAAVYGPREPVPAVVIDEPYSRGDVDAITAAIACRQLARNSVEVARCDTRR